MGSYWRDLIGSVFFPINLDDLKGFWPRTKFWGFLEIKTKQKTSIFVVYLSNKCQKMNEWAPGTTVLLLFWVGITFFCRFGGFGNLGMFFWATFGQKSLQFYSRMIILTFSQPWDIAGMLLVLDFLFVSQSWPFFAVFLPQDCILGWIINPLTASMLFLTQSFHLR